MDGVPLRTLQLSSVLDEPVTGPSGMAGPSGVAAGSSGSLPAIASSSEDEDEDIAPAMPRPTVSSGRRTHPYSDEFRMTKRPRILTPRLGKSARVRGGSAGGGMAPIPVVEEEVVEAVRPRGGCKTRGGRASRRSPQKRPRPCRLDGPVLCDISEMPADQGLLIPRRQKRMRSLKPSKLAPAASPLPTPSVASSSPEACAEPSPAMFESESPPTTPITSTTKHLSRRFRQNIINYGSDAGSDESDAEEDFVCPVISRVLRSVMETPLDHEEDAAGDSALVDFPVLVDVPVLVDDPVHGDIPVLVDEPVLVYVPVLIDDPAPAEDPAPDTVALEATNQPWRWYDFEWKAFPDSPIPPESRRETFSKINVGPTTPRVDPYDIFVDIWDRKIMEHIASETNRYAQQLAAQKLRNHSLLPESRIANWRDTTVDELYVFFGLILAMGIVVKSRIDEYWSSSPDVLYTPGFKAHMPINRFMILNRCLHFNNNVDMSALQLDSSEARLFKLQPLLTHLNMKFQSMYTPGQNIAVDESLLMWKGSLDINPFIPNKTATVGFKTYELYESQTGYLWRFEVHSRKRTQRSTDPLEASIPSIVLRLTQGLEHKGYTLWMDSFYNSPCLARRLKCLGFDCVGTLRTNRKFVPQTLHGLAKEDMRPGQITGLTSGDVNVMVWRDINRVAMISTYHGNSQQKFRGSIKPTLILDYNIVMGGMDKKDKLLSMYPIERKQTKVWYKKLFKRLLNVSVLNSYIIHHHSSSLGQRNFRINLVNSLLSKHCTSRPISMIKPKQPVDVSHRIGYYPVGKNLQRLRRVCAVCRKTAQTFCVGCVKAVCREPCFVTYHS